ncbi:hypothetical protein HKT18_01500 [Flavobacterium sp. IMCC34852]|uniref:Uncharacterized protein n=1 Tax=Flavobacterium rivulicola TaxID=2732161 RepID=A0A7Y3VXR8_9FLAO|nr:hypothetical protein [Flavobacterium sp. IMCC34852]NNT70878.1 hypothetical protein [Flavobacterium sp. IMCC34852]
MKKLFLSLLLFTMPFVVFSQKISKEDFETKYTLLLENLTSEKWKEAEKTTSELLKKIENDTLFSHENKVLRYIFIYTNAGLLNQKVISKEEAYEKIKWLKGKELIMPAHPFSSDSYINVTSLAENNKSTFISMVNNANGTQLFSFEYVTIEDGIKETAAELNGKLIVLSGTLEEISVEGNMLPRYKLIFKKGSYEIIEN